MLKADLTKGRGLIYIAGLVCGGLALAGYADFDRETWTLTIYPFNVKEAVLTAVSWGGNGLAALAVIRGWGKK